MAADLKSKTVAELKQILRDRGQPVSGTKAILIHRIKGTGSTRTAIRQAPPCTVLCRTPARDSPYWSPPRPQQSSLKSKTVSELKQILRDGGESTTGIKAVLIHRIKTTGLTP